jgi:hypothetical protein
MELKETKGRNDCGGEGQQQFNWQTDQPAIIQCLIRMALAAAVSCDLVASQQGHDHNTTRISTVENHNLAMPSEDSYWVMISESYGKPKQHVLYWFV